MKDMEVSYEAMPDFVFFVVCSLPCSQGEYLIVAEGWYCTVICSRRKGTRLMGYLLLDEGTSFSEQILCYN